MAEEIIGAAVADDLQKAVGLPNIPTEHAAITFTRKPDMKEFSAMFVAGILTVALAVPLSAQTPDISGQWELTRAGGGGGGRGGGGGGRGGGGGGPIKMVIEQDGDTFTGTLEMPFGEATISEGTIKGEEIAFTVSMETPRGPVEMQYTGKIEGDTMSGTATTPRGESEWTAKKVET